MPAGMMQNYGAGAMSTKYGLPYSGKWPSISTLP